MLNLSMLVSFVASFIHSENPLSVKVLPISLIPTKLQIFPSYVGNPFIVEVTLKYLHLLNPVSKKIPMSLAPMSR